MAKKFVRGLSSVFESKNKDQYKDSIVFLEDTKQIWTNGTYYGGLNDNITRVTWKELVAMRQSRRLIPGHQYHIVDYKTTVANQVDIISAGNPFDIIVTADSCYNINENARAIHRDSDMYIFYQEEGDSSYCYTGEIVTWQGRQFYKYYDENGASDAQYLFDIKKDFLSRINSDGYLIPDYKLDPTQIFQPLTQEDVDQNKFIVDISGYGYFIDSNLRAWELKYCLDNDANRFMWADSEGEYYPYEEEYESTVDDVFVEYAQIQDYTSDYMTLCLYKTHRSGTLDQDDPDFDDGCAGSDYTNTYYYVGNHTYKGSNYDVWIKTYIDDKGNITDDFDGCKRYYLTKPIVSSTDWTVVNREFDENYYFLEPLEIEYTIVTSSDYATEPTATGVIYYMKDEFNNECHYDFKNIKFLKRKPNPKFTAAALKTLAIGRGDKALWDNQNILEKTGEYLFTFNCEGVDISMNRKCSNNKIGSYRDGYGAPEMLPNVVFDAYDGFIHDNIVDQCSGNIYMYGESIRHNTISMGSRYVYMYAKYIYENEMIAMLDVIMLGSQTSLYPSASWWDNYFRSFNHSFVYNTGDMKNNKILGSFERFKYWGTSWQGNTIFGEVKDFTAVNINYLVFGSIHPTSNNITIEGEGGRELWGYEIKPRAKYLTLNLGSENNAHNIIVKSGEYGSSGAPYVVNLGDVATGKNWETIIAKKKYSGDVVVYCDTDLIDVQQ